VVYPARLAVCFSKSEFVSDFQWLSRRVGEDPIRLPASDAYPASSDSLRPEMLCPPLADAGRAAVPKENKNTKCEKHARENNKSKNTNKKSA
jgi:hypothetical protein